MPAAPPWERWSTHLETTVTVDLPSTGVSLRLAQDPNSGNLGLTVWDASIVLAAWADRNAQKGELGRARVAGKRVIDLGAGAGVAGLALALLGADVVLTDVAAVLPLLRTNADVNLGPAARRSLPGGPGSAGTVAVMEYDWLRPDTWGPLLEGGPADVLLACDCVYKEAMVAPFLAAVLALCGPGRKTTVVVVNEFRSASVQAAWAEAFSRHFTWRKVPRARLHPTYQHESIDILLLKRRSGAGGGALPPAPCSSSASPAAGVGSAGGGGGEGGGREPGGGAAAAAAVAAVADLAAAAAAATLDDMTPPTAAEP